MNALAGSRLLLDRARVASGMAVIDVGSGPGRLALPAAERVGPAGRVVALDLQPAMIRRIEERIAATGVGNVEPLLAGAGEGRMPRDAFDRAFLVTVLGEIVDQAAALQEIHGALRPGGLLSITEVLPDPHFQPRRRVRRLAEAAGFQLSETVGPWYAFTMNFSKPNEGGAP
ncbi:MAG: class I SAM-dependent methyltransferase [Gemmatimonadota bacterium]|nr:MAG: class I SAM-dependent methyltransferase [Gemmatimonadota bacterium]